MNRKLEKLSLFVAATLFFLLALPHRTLAQTPLFNPQTEYAAGTATGPSCIVVGDFNGDGKLDLAVTNFSDRNVSVLLGNGDGTFQPAQSFSVGPNPWYFAVGDFNGDGKLDLAVADYGCAFACTVSPSNTVTVLLGNGDGTFRAGPQLTVGNGPAGVAVGDFNGDGKQDLGVSNFDDNNRSVPLGDTGAAL